MSPLWRRNAAVFVILLLLAGSTAPIEAQGRPNNVVHVRDYTRGDCSVDDTAGFQTAINVWRSGQASRSTGELHIDAGCYQVFGTLALEPWPGQHALFGNVVGDGPEVTTIQGVCGVTTMTIRDYKYGEIGGFKLSGRCGQSNGHRNTDLNHAGLLVGSAAPQMGVNGARFHNITMEHYALGLGVGDWRTAGSAAENIFDNIGISQSHIGVMFAGFNTLDNVFHVLNVAETDIGVYSDSGYTNQFYGGSGNNNGTTFYLAACCEWLIDGWREEYGANTQYWIQYGSPAAPNRLIVRGSNTVDTLNPHRAFPEAIHPLTSAAALQLESSMLNGAVGGKYVSIRHSSFTNGRAIVGNPASLEIIGSCLADINNGQCTQDLPNQISGLGASSPPAPTATPAPASPTGTPTQTAMPTATPAATLARTPTPVPVSGSTVRWDSRTPVSPTGTSVFATTHLKFTNTNSTAWTGVRLTNVWLDQAGQVVAYGDTVNVPNTVAGGTVEMDLGLVTPAAPGSYIVRVMLLNGATPDLDIPTTVQR